MAGPEDYPEICRLYGILVHLLEDAAGVEDDLKREELAVRRCYQFLSYLGVSPHLLDPLRDIADRNRYELNKRWYGSRVRHPKKTLHPAVWRTPLRSFQTRFSRFILIDLLSPPVSRKKRSF